MRIGSIPPQPKGVIPDAWRTNSLSPETANNLVEHAIGIGSLPVIGIPITINDIPRVLPIVVHTNDDVVRARRISDTIIDCTTTSIEPYTVGQIQMVAYSGSPFSRLSDFLSTCADEIIQAACQKIPRHIEGRGGKITDLLLRKLSDGMAVIEFKLTTKNAMGANLVVEAAAGIAGYIAQQPIAAEWTPQMSILSNDGEGRLVAAYTVVSKDDINGHAITDHLGVIVGRTVSRIAQGNAQDWRAQDASFRFHAAAQPVISIKDIGTQFGIQLNLPVVFGTAGGRIKKFPTADATLSDFDRPSASKFGEIAASVALAMALDHLRYPASAESVLRIGSPIDWSAREISPSIKFRTLTLNDRHMALFGKVVSPLWLPPLGNTFSDGYAQLPFSVVPNVLINGRSITLPALQEEPSVIAATSRGNKINRRSGGMMASFAQTDTSYQIEMRAIFTKDAIKECAPEVPDTILDQFLNGVRFATLSSQRAITNNKGADNIIGPTILALGFDPFIFSSSMMAPTRTSDGKTQPVFSWQQSETALICEFFGSISKDALVPIFPNNVTDTARSLINYSNPSDAIIAAIGGAMLANLAAIDGLVTGRGMSGHMALHNRAI